MKYLMNCFQKENFDQRANIEETILYTVLRKVFF